MTMTDIKSMTQEEITDALRAMGEPAFRGKQVFSWLHKGATDFAEMNNLSKPLREKLSKEFTITAPTIARKQVSRLDGTCCCCTHPFPSKENIPPLYIQPGCCCYKAPKQLDP